MNAELINILHIAIMKMRWNGGEGERDRGEGRWVWGGGETRQVGRIHPSS